MEFVYRWQYLVRLLFWVRQRQKRKRVIVDTSGTIATTDSVAVVIRDTHKGIINPDMPVPET